MSNKRFYQETFSQVHGSADIRWEDFQNMKRAKHIRKLAALIAAAAAAAALSGLAVAANLFGLRDILLPEKHSVYVVDDSGAAVPGQYEYKDFISLSGYQATPESQALAEWQAFLETYDQDGEIIGEIGNAPTGFEERYGLYLVYTQEMADTLESIVEKYGLELHSAMEVVLPSVWPEAVGGNFLQENNTAWSGYIYENGTFRFDGGAELGEGELKGYGLIEYQFSRSVKGTFDDVMLNIGDLNDFEEWGYQTKDGTPVTLGLGAWNRSLIVADLEDSFVLVNVLTGRQGDDTFSSGAIGREELEELADSFEFSVLTPAKRPDLDAVREAGERELESEESRPIETEEPPEDPLYTRTGIQTDVAENFVQLLAERIEDGRREEVANLLVYPAVIETPEGTVTVTTPEELLEHYDATIGESARTLASDMAWDPSPENIFSDGSGLAAAADGSVWFGQIEEGDIRVYILQTDQWSIRAVSMIE